MVLTKAESYKRDKSTDTNETVAKEHLVSVPQMLSSKDYLLKWNTERYFKCRPSGLNWLCAFRGLFPLSGMLCTSHSPPNTF